MITKENLRRKNFDPDEFFVSTTALINNIINYPGEWKEQAILHCLMSTADAAQEIRNLLFAEWSCRVNPDGQKFVMKINSGYRNEEVNKLVGSRPNSQHLQGLAIDFICPAFGTPEQIVKFLHSKKFLADQCFIENSLQGDRIFCIATK